MRYRDWLPDLQRQIDKLRKAGQMNLEQQIQADDAAGNPKDGGDWGGVMPMTEFVQRSRVSLRNNVIYIEHTRGDGTAGIYEVAHASAAGKFL